MAEKKVKKIEDDKEIKATKKKVKKAIEASSIEEIADEDLEKAEKVEKSKEEIARLNKEIATQIAKEKNFKVAQVANTMALMDEGATVAFVARYRKELTGNLDEVQIGDIYDSITYMRNLANRKDEVIRLIAAQDKLTDELKAQIEAAVKLQEVEDLYYPYRKKRKTKADVAKENGLEPLSISVLLCKDMKALEKEAKKYINDNVPNVAAAIDGAKLIIAQNISEDAKYRERIRDILYTSGILTVKESKKAKELDTKKVYVDYYDYKGRVKGTPSHRVLAINRGEKEGVLTVSIQLEERDYNRAVDTIFRDFPKQNLAQLYQEIVDDTLERLILPSAEREVRSMLTSIAEDASIEVFQKNLKSLLMQPPLKSKAILALDPGYRTGCKVAIIDKSGFFVTNDVFYLVEGIHNDNQIASAEKKALEYMREYGIEIVVIGNGTASRETEKFVANLIHNNKLKAKYIMANEAGASVYSASKIAAEEFPELDVTVRGAISIGRRIQDPLPELVKIDPKSLGVGLYQHDIEQGRLSESLETVVSHVVNSVGADLNTASWALLSYISGVKKNIAKNIVEYRRANGNFKNRKELLKVKGLGPKAYEQMAGFLVINDGEEILDTTIIHPESYHIAREIIAEAGSDIDEYKKDIRAARKKIEKFDCDNFIKAHDYGKETVRDIFDALTRERRDPRDDIEKPILKSNVLTMDDLKDGMILQGTVRNVVPYGAFIDIGLHDDALLHISQMSDQHVSNPGDVLSAGQILKVKIHQVDKDRNRVSLTLKNMNKNTQSS